jgi:multidrug efflux pump subunit AcrA (membrane-fusion protein)
MVPTVDRAKATVMAKIKFTELDPRILPEMSAKVSFLSQEMPEGERTARTVLQPAAIVQRDGKSVVFVIKGDKVSQVAIETGAKIGEMVEIKSGVAAGDRVVMRPSEKLHDGAPIALSAK